MYDLSGSRSSTSRHPFGVSISYFDNDTLCHHPLCIMNLSSPCSSVDIANEISIRGAKEG